MRVGGSRQYSHWHLQELLTAVGAAGVAVIDNAFPWQDTEAENRTRGCAALDDAWVSSPASDPQGAGRPGSAGEPATTSIEGSCFLVCEEKRDGSLTSPCAVVPAFLAALDGSAAYGAGAGLPLGQQLVRHGRGHGVAVPDGRIVTQVVTFV